MDPNTIVHLYEELLDGRLWLELEVTELKAGFLEKDRVIRLSFPSRNRFSSSVLAEVLPSSATGAFSLD